MFTSRVQLQVAEWEETIDCLKAKSNYKWETGEFIYKWETEINCLQAKSNYKRETGDRLFTEEFTYKWETRYIVYKESSFTSGRLK